MAKISINIDNTMSFISDEEFENIQPVISEAHERLESGQGAGADYRGWLHLPSAIPQSLKERIINTSGYIRENADIFISIGIGGSYLGAKAAAEFINHTFYNQISGEKRNAPEIYFAGHNLSSDYLSDLIDIIEDKRICINVISKSGTTTEPAVSFRILKELLEKRHGREEAKKRIIVTTDEEKGALKSMADKEGYETYIIPDDVGGRYSVLTPVGLLPIAVSNIDINELIKGAEYYEGITSKDDIMSNPAYLYSAARNIIYRKGKIIELLSSFHPSLHYIAEWWKQLTGESEGKNRQGIYPASCDFTTDLHSMGQWIQEGKRVIFETFMVIERSKREIKIPHFNNDDDNLNYIAGRSLDYVNENAYRGTAMAHKEGGVPNMTISLSDRSPETLGQLFYFFERAIALSGYLQWINPFNQPGVEFYKRNMFKLLGKPGIK